MKDSEKRKASCKKWKSKNRIKINKYQRDWLARSPDAKARYSVQRKIKYDPIAKKQKDIQKMYGVSISDYENMIRTQGGRCALCGGLFSIENRNPCIDHDHKTGIVRGILHNKCNRALGLLRDDPLMCDLAASYLRRILGTVKP
jgi:hypothetical protein